MRQRPITWRKNVLQMISLARTGNPEREPWGRTSSGARLVARSCTIVRPGLIELPGERSKLIKSDSQLIDNVVNSSIRLIVFKNAVQLCKTASFVILQAAESAWPHPRRFPTGPLLRSIVQCDLRPTPREPSCETSFSALHG